MGSSSTKIIDIERDMSVDEVMREWPQTIQVFIKNHMLCIGCALATYHSVDYAAKEHDLDTAALLIELNNAATAPRK
jgi:hybrid cluster-associated redox disulfide protein